MSKGSKTSWDYQKDKYKQVNIKFNMNNEIDAAMHYYLTCKADNATGLLKELLYLHMEEEANREP